MPTANRIAKERHLKYTTWQAKRICELISQGYSIPRIVKDEEIRTKHNINVLFTSTIYKWIRDIPEFQVMVEQAYRDRADTFLEKYLDVMAAVEDGTMPLSKAKFLAEHQQWLLDRTNPRIIENLQKEKQKQLQITANEGSAIQIILAEPQKQLSAPRNPDAVWKEEDGEEGKGKRQGAGDILEAEEVPAKLIVGNTITQSE